MNPRQFFVVLYECCENVLKDRQKLCKFGTFWPISNFRIFAKIKTRCNFGILFLKTVQYKGLLEQIKKKVEFLLLSPLLKG